MNGIGNNKGEIVMYQPDETIRLEVRVEYYNLDMILSVGYRVNGKNLFAYLKMQETSAKELA